VSRYSPADWSPNSSTGWIAVVSAAPDRHRYQFLSLPSGGYPKTMSNFRYCITLPADLLQEVCDNVSGFGDTWVTGWKDGRRCVWCNNEVTAVKIVLMTGTLMEVIGDE
jgi:hypothetical protein